MWSRSSLGKLLLEVCTHSITLQLTTGKGPALLSLTARSITQLTTQKAGAGSHTAISRWWFGPIDTFTLGDIVRILSVWARLHCLSISLIGKRWRLHTGQGVISMREKKERQYIIWRDYFIHFAWIFLKIWGFFSPLLSCIPFVVKGSLCFHPFPIFHIHCIGCTAMGVISQLCTDCISSPKKRYHYFAKGSGINYSFWE